MGKPTGFLEFERLTEAAEPATSRVKHYHEFVSHLSPDEAKTQAARCMDCGIPFCNNGCPVNNIIPDWNDLVYRGKAREALAVLHSTNNFPDFTGRICPAPCEAACTLNINAGAVGIKSIEHFIVDQGWENGWIVPQPAAVKTGKRVAIVGGGPAGLAAAQQLARAGHAVVVFEKNERVGGLLRFGIPDFKFDKSHIDRRVAQMEAEGVEFRTGRPVGGDAANAIPVVDLVAEFDAIVLSGGAEKPRDLPVPGRELGGVHFAMEFLAQQNRVVAGTAVPGQILATGKKVVVIGGGDTGSDCVGTSNRQGAASVVQLELMPQPPESENKPLTWPYWPLKMRTSSSHEEGCQREFAVGTQEILGKDGRVKALRVARIEMVGGVPTPVAGSEFEIEADLVLLAMGFVSPVKNGLLEELGVALDARGAVRATTEGADAYATSVPKVFAAGDMRRGQSLVVWAIREGRQCAREVDAFLMGSSTLPR
ncbi:glutamate synthase subunit beta [Rhodocyclus tenuis]|uniref:Glutamate synthase subunit beta n=1 Tax=Rhodocyclus gracilis TaxID=2929842 RepID=A0ABX0WFL3_9RHOO|nr:glutamate synthase subunit beta [Rhodocyclus gracilis]NJA88513.1 glutamate synthase subunit beta [Rhodocyclus gracilis]